MDVPLSYLVSPSQTKAVSLKTEKGDVLYSVKEDNQEPQPFITFCISNLGIKAVLDLMANGSDFEQQQQLIFHSRGKPIHRVNEIFPLTRRFLTAAGTAGGPTIEYRSVFWVDQSLVFQESFNKVIQQYQSDVFEVDFGNVEHLLSEVNTWIAEKTRGLIKDSVESIDIRADTKLIIGSTLYFDGEWSVPFIDAGFQEFTGLDGTKIMMPFMKSTQEEQYVQQFKNYKILSIPYTQHSASEFSMLFYLPDNPRDIRDLRDFIGKYDSVTQDVYFPETQKMTNLLIPKFTLDVRSGLAGEFVFERLVTTTMSATEGSIDGSFRIDERGTTAAGATAFFIDQSPEKSGDARSASVPRASMDKIEFIANRPFMFFIRDNKFGRMLISGGIHSFDYDNRP